DQVVETVLSPQAVSMQKELNIRGSDEPTTLGIELFGQLRPPVKTNVSGDPRGPVKGKRLPLGRLLSRRAKLGVAEANSAIYPDVAAVRPAEGQGVREADEEVAVNRRAIGIDDPNDAAHRTGMTR
ncbi:MAG: hypothetical protein HW416_188, partial [Chloroflexi bacterium]|nr:hypothetical protein [Chloroflexota bacterium]